MTTLDQETAEHSRSIPDDSHPSAMDLARYSGLALHVLADLNQWAASYGKALQRAHLEAAALSITAISPWRTAEQLRLNARMAAWLYALDDFLDVDAVSLTEVDDMLTRCSVVARTGAYDHNHPVPSALADICRELMIRPAYPTLATLWRERFDKCLADTRFTWQASHSPDKTNNRPSIDQYLEHSDSYTVWIAYLTVWISNADPDSLPRHLNDLIAAGDDGVVATRLANDLATADREQGEGTLNAVALGVPEDWIRQEIITRMTRFRRCLAPLIATGFAPAIELARTVEWLIGIYAVTDLRVATLQRAPKPVSGTT